MTILKINATQSNLLAAVISTVGGLGLMALLFFLNNRETGVFIIAVLLVLFKLFVYQNLDLWFSKTFLKKGDHISLRCAGINFKLDLERSFLRIDSNLNLSRVNAKHPTLNVHRNPSNVLLRLFKNKIKLQVPDENDLSDIEALAKEISKKIGIRFMNNYIEDV